MHAHFAVGGSHGVGCIVSLTCQLRQQRQLQPAGHITPRRHVQILDLSIVHVGKQCHTEHLSDQV